MKKGFMTTILGLIVTFSFGQHFPVLKGKYLGQTPPGNVPVQFAPGFIK